MSENRTLLHLSESHGHKILEYLRTRSDLYVRAPEERRFIEAILWGPQRCPLAPFAEGLRGVEHDLQAL